MRTGPGPTAWPRRMRRLDCDVVEARVLAAAAVQAVATKSVAAQAQGAATCEAPRDRGTIFTSRLLFGRGPSPPLPGDASCLGYVRS